MERKKPDELDIREWTLLGDIIRDHQEGAGFNECFIGTRFNPQSSYDTLTARRLYLKDYFTLINPPEQTSPEGWSPVYIISQKTKKQFNLLK